MPTIRRIVPYLWSAVVLALLQLAWVFFARQHDTRRYERDVESRHRPVASAPLPDSQRLRIPWFYANRGTLVAGEQAVVCYGVENALRVRLQPPVEQLKPAFNRCFGVTPRRTTTYTLTAEGADGKTVDLSFTIKVEPPPPRILFVSISHKEIRRGQPWTLCYGVQHATRAWLDPGSQPVPPVEKRCLRSFPGRSTDFTLFAGDDRGRVDREQFRLVVH